MSLSGPSDLQVWALNGAPEPCIPTVEAGDLDHYRMAGMLQLPKEYGKRGLSRSGPKDVEHMTLPFQANLD